MNNTNHLFHQAERNFFSMISMHQLSTSCIRAYVSGVDSSSVNPAFIQQINEDLSNDLSCCVRFYAEHTVPWTLAIPEYLRSQQINELLSTQQFSCHDEGIAMGLLLSDINLAKIDSALDIRTMDESLQEWSIPLIYGFGSTPEITQVYTQRHEVAVQAQKPIHHFSGYINDKAVCSLSLSITAEYTARIDDVATMPEYQNKGYATALIAAVLSQLKKTNMHYCFLEASTAGFNIYKRIGFNELFKNYYYER